MLLAGLRKTRGTLAAEFSPALASFGDGISVSECQCVHSGVKDVWTGRGQHETCELFGLNPTAVRGDGRSPARAVDQVLAQGVLGEFGSAVRSPTRGLRKCLTA